MSYRKSTNSTLGQHTANEPGRNEAPASTGRQVIEWWRAYHGMTCDPKWILVAQTAGEGVTPGHVSAVWTALCERASQGRPRGSIAGFNARALAASYGWPVSLIEAVAEALRAEGLIDGDLLVSFKKLQSRDDTTATDRKRRQRAREKEARMSGDDAAGVTGVTRDICDDESRQSRASQTERERESLSRYRASQDSNNSTPYIHLDARRVDAGDVWRRLEQAGIPAGVIARTRHVMQIRQWVEQGITLDQIDAAIARARKCRAEQRDPSPLNVGYIGSCLAAVINGTGRAHGFERGDSAVDAYLTSRG